MCGIPGSGKSTLAKSLPLTMMEHNKLNIIQSDKTRINLLIDAGFLDTPHQNFIPDELMSQENKRKLEDKVWEGIEVAVKDTLEAGEDIVIDATNTEQKVLDDWFTFGIQFGFKIKVIIMTTPLNICIERNSIREEPVPENVMNYMYNSYIMTIGWLYMEHSEKIINSAHLQL